MFELLILKDKTVPQMNCGFLIYCAFISRAAPHLLEKKKKEMWGAIKAFLGVSVNTNTLI